jgi:hypothetical protein
MEKTRKAYKISVGKPLVSMRRLEDNIQPDLRKMG